MQCRKPRRRVCLPFSLQARLASRIVVDLVVDRLHKMAGGRGLRRSSLHDPPRSNDGTIAGAARPCRSCRWRRETVDCHGLPTGSLRSIPTRHVSLATQNLVPQTGEGAYLPVRYSGFVSTLILGSSGPISRLDLSFRSNQCLAKLSTFCFDIGWVCRFGPLIVRDAKSPGSIPRNAWQWLSADFYETEVTLKLGPANPCVIDEDRVLPFAPFRKQYKVKMSIQLTAPTELFFQPAEMRTSASVSPEAKLTEPSPYSEPKGRPWKLSARPVAPKFVVVELFVPALFFLVALAGIVSCFFELSHLLQSDAGGYVAMKAINWGG
jgi:hypothetical protein